MLKKILIVVDDRPSSQIAIRTGIDLAKDHQASILFFHPYQSHVFPGSDLMPALAIDPEELRSKESAKAHKLLTAASKQAELAGVPSARASGSGLDSSQCVADAAYTRHCDLIVVGTEGRSALMRLIKGSMVPGLISWADVPVLVCREAPRGASMSRRANAAMKARERKRELIERRRREAND